MFKELKVVVEKPADGYVAYPVVSNGVSARHVAVSNSPPSRIGTGCADAIRAIRPDEAMTMSFGGSSSWPTGSGR
jgi:hypothetical protein